MYILGFREKFHECDGHQKLNIDDQVLYRMIIIFCPRIEVTHSKGLLHLEFSYILYTLILTLENL